MYFGENTKLQRQIARLIDNPAGSLKKTLIGSFKNQWAFYIQTKAYLFHRSILSFSFGSFFHTFSSLQHITIICPNRIDGFKHCNERFCSKHRDHRQGIARKYVILLLQGFAQLQGIIQQLIGTFETAWIKKLIEGLICWFYNFIIST